MHQGNGQDEISWGVDREGTTVCLTHEKNERKGGIFSREYPSDNERHSSPSTSGEGPLVSSQIAGDFIRRIRISLF